MKLPNHAQGIHSPDSRSVTVPIWRWRSDGPETASDRTDLEETHESFVATFDELAAEEPLEIRLVYGPDSDRRGTSLAITMRTPGDDGELAVGFLLSEGLLRRRADLEAIVLNGAESADDDSEEQRADGSLDSNPDQACPPSPLASTANLVTVHLHPSVEVDQKKLQRHFYRTSSCGICGKSSLAALEHQGMRPIRGPVPALAATWLANLPAELRRAQQVFQATGGLHAAGLFAANGSLRWLREDVGRHNAVDKILGRLLLDEQWPARGGVLVVSGRLSFELVQKAVVAQIPVVVAIGAPSSLAVQCAERFGITLLGFVTANRFNCFSHPERVHWSGPGSQA